MTIFTAGNEIKPAWWKAGKVEDNVFGTLIGVREMESQLPGKKGELVKIYEILADGGEFHETDENKKPVEIATTINKGETWLVGGSAGLDNAMRNVKVGQIVGIKFTEEKPSKTKGFNPTKVKKVFTDGNMNKGWLEEREKNKVGNDF